MRYDFLIVGAGPFGATFAHLAKEDGYSCLIVDKRQGVGGNCYTENMEGIHVHKYGPHIFHTNDQKIWQFVNRFATFNGYVHRVKANHQDRLYSFPINLQTLNELYGIQTADEAERYFQSVRIPVTNPANLEEWILGKIGPELYGIFIEGYTAKQWGKHPRELPASIIKRLPIRLTNDDRYFADDYQGVPVGGYTQLFENMLDGISVVLSCDYLTNRQRLDRIAHRVVYTGPIDDFFDHRFGSLEWRSLHFEFIRVPERNFQTASIVNYPSSEVKHTRVVEYKHFDQIETKNTIISVEYPLRYHAGEEKYYPINSKENLAKLNRYNSLIDHSKYIFGGRLAEYKYYDMHQVIASAIHQYQLATRR